MLTRVVTAASLVFVSLVGAIPAQAQYRVHYGFGPPTPPTNPSFTVYVGYMDMGHYINGPLGSSETSGDAGLVGAQLTLPLSPNFALVGNIAHANSTLVFFVPEGGGPTAGNSEVWIFDGDIQLSAPFRSQSGHWIDPFLQAGIGGMRYDTQNAAGSENATNLAFNVGAGLDYMISRSVGIRILGKDYIGHWSEPTGNPYESGDHWTNNWSISGGLKFGL
jgi:hypothetical protein